MIIEGGYVCFTVLERSNLSLGRKSIALYFRPLFTKNCLELIVLSKSCDLNNIIKYEGHFSYSYRQFYFQVLEYEN